MIKDREIELDGRYIEMKTEVRRERGRRREIWRDKGKETG